MRLALACALSVMGYAAPVARAQLDKPKEATMAQDKPYDEVYRPQFHFTARENWLNDPNGLMYYEGEYHLFFQHNPTGIESANQHWGHAVSPDLLHWTQLPDAIKPDRLGMIWSGSGVVDVHNAAGFQTGAEKALVCIYTSAGGTSPESEGQPFTQSLAYSNDRGRTWTKYAGNPVLGHILGGNRDPKVIWYEPARHWVMALYLDGSDYALFTSPDLKHWTRACDVQLPGSGECPDFFELPVDGNPANTRWVFWGANGNYLLGRFDGAAFTPESGPLQSSWGGNFYAAQTWSSIPPADGRRIQIGWMAGGEYPGMPFNQQMSFPCELTLRTTPDGVRLCHQPVREIASIRGAGRTWSDLTLRPGEDPLAGTTGDLFEIQAEIEPGAAKKVGFMLRGQKVEYEAANHTVTCLGHSAPLASIDGRISLHILLDRTSIEVFGNGGLAYMATCFLPDPADKEIGVCREGGGCKIVNLSACELDSTWTFSAQIKAQ